MFADEMEDYGHDLHDYFVDDNIWASDAVEDDFEGGADHIFVDSVDLFMFAGHGGAGTSGGIQFYQAPLCLAGDATTCRWTAGTHGRLGETDGSYSDPNPGEIRWMMWSTCNSVDTRPNQQWSVTMRHGLQYILGYKGLVTDSENSDENPEVFAEEAFGDDQKFRASWFYAVEDWWFDEVGSVVASGVDSTSATSRRNNLKRTTAAAGASDFHDWFAWSYHEG